MPTTALNTFDTTLEKTNQWLNEICDDLAWDNKHAAYTVLRATLHALRDRLPVKEACNSARSCRFWSAGFITKGGIRRTSR